MSAPSGHRFIGNILLDAPADDPALNFSQITEALSAVIESSAPRFAVGIFGGWGSGKSTLMASIRRRLERRPDIIACEFNAWRYEREPHLIIPLLDTIRARIWKWSEAATTTPDQKRVAQRIAAQIGRVVRALARSTSVDIGLPGAVRVSIDPSHAVDELTKDTPPPAESQSLYFGAFEQLSEAFADVAGAGVSKVVVFVDDLDRCLPEQALAVLESMKLFFDIPGFVFVVGLDEHVVQSAVRSKFARFASDGRSELMNQLERDYLKKVFQVPYTLPPMVAGQLGELLAWIDIHEQLLPPQREDLHTRVSRYLVHVAVEGRINPREVKRFINTYTLSRMIRQDLEPNVILALQVVDFRPDWERIYDEVILGEPDVAATVIREFREGNDRAFDDMWPELGAIPVELATFLRSDEGSVLARPDLERYVTFLETTRTSQSWITEAMRAVGELRACVRAIDSGGSDLSSGTMDLSQTMTNALNRLTRSIPSAQPAGSLPARIDDLTRSINQLDNPIAAGGAWGEQTRAYIDQIQQELRIIRRSASFAF